MIFNQDQVDFLQTEFGLSIAADKEAGLSNGELIQIQDDAFEIEVDELLASGKNNPLTKRGDIAVSIVDLLSSP